MKLLIGIVLLGAGYLGGAMDAGEISKWWCLLSFAGSALGSYLLFYKLPNP